MKVENKSGIYLIKNIKTSDCYVGSAVNISERWRRHKKDLRGQKHHSQYLNRSWLKYGEENFEFYILEECTIENLCDKENYYIKTLKPVFNTCNTAYSSLGYKHTPEAIAKIKKYLKDNNVKPPLTKLKPVMRSDGVTFDSLTNACISVGKTGDFCSTISKCCNGKRKTAFGFSWSWL